MARNPVVPLASLLLLSTLLPEPAHAGIPECRGMRLEDVSNCELRGSVDCNAGCEKLGIYKKACATQLQTVCRKEKCVLSADSGCTDECTVGCSMECDQGINITCAHNCYRECEGACDAQCEDASDPEQCQASCQSTCDGECDVQCGNLVNGTCYEHCIECCGGSCTAQANMTCQANCQEEEFETCELEFRAECDASCDVDGALFCDDEYVLSGSDLLQCTRALIAQGSLSAEVEGDLDVSVGDLGDASNGASLNSGGCSLAAPGSSNEPPAYNWTWLLLLGILPWRRNP